MTRRNGNAAAAGDGPRQKRVKSSPENESASRRNQALCFLGYLKDNFSVEIYQDFLETMCKFQSGSISPDDLKKKVKNLLGKHDDLVRQFNIFLPEHHKIPLMPPTFKVALKFIRKVKNRFAGDEYKSLLEILGEYKIKGSYEEAKQKVGKLFQNHPDLYAEFLHFIHHCSDMEDGTNASDNTSSGNGSGIEHELKGLVEADGQDQSEGRGVVLNQKPLQRIGNSVAIRLQQGREDAKESFQCNSVASSGGAKTHPKRNMARPVELSEAEKNKVLEIVEREKERKSNIVKDEEREQLERAIDSTDDENCNPSYRLLPKNNQTPASKGTEPVRAPELNDICILYVASDSEDKYFNHPQSEYEDDRFELDMLLHRVQATIVQLEMFLNEIGNKPAQVQVEDHLNALSLRCIERLYGEHSLLVMDALRNDPRLALPVIISRLKTKQEEWLGCYSDFGKIWTEVVKKNYQKAVDYSNPIVEQLAAQSN